ncbi:4-amino-4-deoxy-L-arabinose-phospho-UDP flippase [Halomonas aquamarina]|uniref:4-amino-4-deoxy-L-arabinose-phospho-UDP flippase n=1 Tax=Vreelandella aquamarina TaxID=77097 RepID=A0ACC5VYR7_9GAMM|nr:4-amino-4-deoxy-L-arabinose-phosphoundecaprenol flippase subunit ArnF [Halomonas aquamarina]MBZ5488884.1 4-amino-4-deoxy-L-arabinose-phospho-UDP flippase [Halomonas aquamarina]
MNRQRGAGSIALILMSVCLVSVAQLAMKWGMSTLALEGFHPSDTVTWDAVLRHGWPSLVSVVAGLGCYALSMLCWGMALKKVPLSMAYPFLSLSYVLVYIGSLFLPGIAEHFSWLKLWGIALILAGVAVTFHGGLRSTRQTAGM